MVPVAKLIFKASVSYLPTKFPVQYYGLPDGRVHLIYARFYNLGIGKSGIEYVFALHKEFLFDYENEKLLPATGETNGNKLFNECVDKPDQKIKIYKIYKKLNSFAEARNKLNEEAQKIEINNTDNPTANIVKISPLFRIRKHSVTA